MVLLRTLQQTGTGIHICAKLFGFLAYIIVVCICQIVKLCSLYTNYSGCCEHTKANYSVLLNGASITRSLLCYLKSFAAGCVVVVARCKMIYLRKCFSTLTFSQSILESINYCMLAAQANAMQKIELKNKSYGKHVILHKSDLHNVCNEISSSNSISLRSVIIKFVNLCHWCVVCAWVYVSVKNINLVM